MKKFQLQTGMRVEVRNGDKFVVMKDMRDNDDSIVVLGKPGYLPLSNYTDSLIDRDGDNEWDIMNIFNVNHQTSSLSSCATLSFLWERIEETAQQCRLRELKELVESSLEKIKELENDKDMEDWDA